LTRPKTIVITESTAKQFFKNEDPIGKTLKFDNKTEYEIVGVAKDWPANSHWHFQILASFCTLRSYTDTNWLSHNLLTYIKTTEGVDEKVLSEKINDLFVQKADPLFQQALGTSIKEWEKSGNYYHLRLTPLAKIYLFSPSDNAVGKKGDIRYVYLFAVIGFFIFTGGLHQFYELNNSSFCGACKRDRHSKGCWFQQKTINQTIPDGIGFDKSSFNDNSTYRN